MVYHLVDMIIPRSITDHFMPAGGTRILDLQPIHKTIHMEGMPALKNRVLLSFLKVLPADRALAILLQLFSVDLQLLITELYALSLMVLLLQDLMQLMYSYGKRTSL